jgi:hypothetical protein
MTDTIERAAMPALRTSAAPFHPRPSATNAVDDFNPALIVR